MKPEYRILLAGIIIIAAFDAAGSIASRQFNFNYALLTLGSFIIYGAFAFIATAKKATITNQAQNNLPGIHMGINVVMNCRYIKCNTANTSMAMPTI